MAVWRSGSGVGHVSEVVLRWAAWARLVLGWMVAAGIQILVAENLFRFNQPPRSIQPGHPSVGRCK